jgi:hypothetical protein
MLCAICASGTALAASFDPTSSYDARQIHGFPVLVHQKLLADPPLAKAVLDELDHQLFQVIRRVPAPAVQKLRAVKIWVELQNRDAVGACYHPSRRWLTDHDFNPDKAKSIEIGHARNFVAWTLHQPFMVLHELAHAYHHQVLGYDHPPVKSAYQRAAESKSYENVLSYNGRTVRHYGLNNDQEYFAECTEAFFGTNDFHPFVRAELKQHDPNMHQILADAWGDVSAQTPLPQSYTIPLLDLASQTHRQVIVDREAGQYLGHISTVLLEDGKTILAVYPKGHGRGSIVLKRSTDAGLTWSARLAVPENWATSLETPTIHRVIDKNNAKRLILFSGLYPIRMAVSEDDGATWTPLKPIGDFGGIVAMGSVEPLRTAQGHYLAMFHDDGRFIANAGKPSGTMTLFKSLSTDGGLTWSRPESIYANDTIHLCEPGVVRSPDGNQLAALLRENRRVRNSHVIFSNDEGTTWTQPRELPGSLTGDRHTARYAPDGRLLISFRDTCAQSPTKGDWVAWVGKYEDLLNRRDGQYRVRLMKNHRQWDCAYPGVEITPDGTFVLTTYGHWQPNQPPYIVAVRLTLNELDTLAEQPTPANPK